MANSSTATFSPPTSKATSVGLSTAKTPTSNTTVFHTTRTTTAENVTTVTTTAENVTTVTTTAENLTTVKTTAENLTTVKTTAENLTTVKTTAENLTTVKTTAENLTTVTTTAENVTVTNASSTATVLSTTYKPTATSSTSAGTTVTSSSFIASATTSVTRTMPKSEAPGNIAAAVIIPILILVTVSVLLFYRKRLKKLCGGNDREPRSEASLALPQYTSLVVDADEFLDYLNVMQKECDFKYAEQFESLQLVGREQTTHQALLKCNVEKNRYINIHPYDITRVKLLQFENEEGSDYINASWIPGYYSKREYIAAQGPLPSTEDDMWRMVWEYQCKGIVMLTNCMEGGRKKCDQYWPEDTEPVVYGDIQVVLVSETSESSKWTIKKLELSMGQQKRTTKLFHFISWPDCGVPQSPEMLLEFMQVVKKELETAKTGPLVVHCSAGVGRTGTYIAIETLQLQLENERQVDVFGVVYRLRLNRVFMVQTEGQYKFIHETIGHLIQQRNEIKTLTVDSRLLNQNFLKHATDPEHVLMTEIQIVTDKTPDIEGKDNHAFDFLTHT